MEIFMNKKDFFDEVDSAIDDNKAKQDNQRKKDKALSVFFSDEIKSITPMLKNYESTLNEKGMKCDLKLGEGSFSFTIKHNNGNNHTLSFSLDNQDEFRSYNFYTYFRDEKNGSPMKSTDAKPYNKENWSHEMVEERIQKHIEDFMFYQKRHM